MKITSGTLGRIFIIAYILIFIALGYLFFSLPKGEYRLVDMVRTGGFMILLAVGFFKLYKKKKNREAKSA